jgi:hypothetical protein
VSTSSVPFFQIFLSTCLSVEKFADPRLICDDEFKFRFGEIIDYPKSVASRKNDRRHGDRWRGLERLPLGVIVDVTVCYNY